MIPESTNKLSDVTIIDNTFIANYLADAQSLVELHSRDGTLIERLALPAIGTAYGFGGLRKDTETFYQFSNFTTPGTTYRLDMKTRKSTLYPPAEAALRSRVSMRRSRSSTPSKDGTQRSDVPHAQEGADAGRHARRRCCMPMAASISR